MSYVLKCENISKSFDGKEIIKNVSLNLESNEIVSIIGVSGIGKTTLFNILSGLLIPDEGNVFIKSESDDEAWTDITGTAGNVSYMLQKDMLLPHKTIIDNVSLPLVLSGMRKKEAREKAMPLFETFGLSGMEKSYPMSLSGGMRQRAALLRTYMCGKKVVLLDEPFCALDEATTRDMHKWYLDISRKLGLSTLLITHDIDEAVKLSDRIYILSGQPATLTYELSAQNDKDNISKSSLEEYRSLLRDKLFD